jgi:hypothetical protein
MNDSQEAKDRSVKRHHAERLHVEGIVVSGLAVEPRLCSVDYEFCCVLSIRHDCQR